MFQRLQKKWKVSGLQVLLILCTFAIGGSLTGYAGKRLMNLLPLEKGLAWVITYVVLVTILWPMAVLLVSVFFGQFGFFIKYLRKIGSRIGLVKAEKSAASKIAPVLAEAPLSPLRVAIFASGAGSNAQKIIDHFRNSATVTVALIVCNKPGAGVLAIAARENIPQLLIDKEIFFRGDAHLAELQKQGIGFIILAGFLWKIPPVLIKAYSRKIINIHPALLPKYGGKGMYGQHVHEAVIAAGEKETGITIHYVDELYDHGAVLFQAGCPVLENDTAESLAQRIHELEHLHYSRVIAEVLANR